MHFHVAAMLQLLILKTCVTWDIDTPATLSLFFFCKNVHIHSHVNATSRGTDRRTPSSTRPLGLESDFLPRPRRLTRALLSTNIRESNFAPNKQIFYSLIRPCSSLPPSLSFFLFSYALSLSTHYVTTQNPLAVSAHCFDGSLESYLTAYIACGSL